MDLHGSPNLREGLKIIPSDSSYGPFSLAPKEDFFLMQLAGSFWALKIG